MTQSPKSVSVVSPGFAGIDVAKDKLDLALSNGKEVITVANDQAGIASLVGRLTAAAPKCIVVEATGGLEAPLVEALLEAHLPVAVVNPGRVRYLAKAMSILAKSDAIDAHLLCTFAEKAEPRLAQNARQIKPNSMRWSPAGASSAEPEPPRATAGSPPAAAAPSSPSMPCSKPWTSRSNCWTKRSAS